MFIKTALSSSFQHFLLPFIILTKSISHLSFYSCNFSFLKTLILTYCHLRLSMCIERGFHSLQWEWKLLTYFVCRRAVEQKNKTSTFDIKFRPHIVHVSALFYLCIHEWMTECMKSTFYLMLPISISVIFFFTRSHFFRFLFNFICTLLHSLLSIMDFFEFIWYQILLSFLFFFTFCLAFNGK